MLSIPDRIFDSRDPACKTPFGAVKAGQKIMFSIFPLRTRGVCRALLILEEDGEKPQEIPMRWFELIGARERYSISLKLDKPGLYWYYFYVEMAEGPNYVSRGYAGKSETDIDVLEKYQLTVYDGSYKTPDWFGRGISYHIFPDRFCRDRVPVQLEGEGLVPRVLHENWDDRPNYKPDENGEILNNDFFGGTLRGVTSKLDYLESLHVTTIYFSPIFQAFSNHRYDTGDYMRIDPLFGSEQDFKTLCSEAGKRGMRVMLDGVFNHTGYDSRYFNGRGNYDSVGAFQSEESPYYSWFDFQRWPDKYSSWWGIYTLPQTNEMDAGYRGFIAEDEDSVVRHWLRLGASGWRLDVADELPDSFIRDLNENARKEKKDAVVIGEVWEDASNKIAYSERRRYFQGGELDGVMNYPLREAILDFLGGGTAEHFAETIETLRENYPHDVFYSLMNVIGTHDTPRALTVLGAEPQMWDKTRDARAEFTLPPDRLEDARRRLKMAAVIQFCMPGSPTIFYGDEAGMQGFEDPFNRGTYPWGKEDRELLDFYRSLGTIRAEMNALQTGKLSFPPSQDGLLQILRSDEQTTLLIAVNRSYHDQMLKLKTSFAIDLLTHQPYSSEKMLRLKLAPQTAMILQCGSEEK